MAGIVTTQKIALVETTPTGVQINTYSSIQALIVELLNSGRVCNTDFGSRAHVSTLETLLIELVKIHGNALNALREEERRR